MSLYSLLHSVFLRCSFGNSLPSFSREQKTYGRASCLVRLMLPGLVYLIPGIYLCFLGFFFSCFLRPSLGVLFPGCCFVRAELPLHHVVHLAFRYFFPWPFMGLIKSRGSDRARATRLNPSRDVIERPNPTRPDSNREFFDLD